MSKKSAEAMVRLSEMVNKLHCVKIENHKNYCEITVCFDVLGKKHWHIQGENLIDTINKINVEELDKFIEVIE